MRVKINKYTVTPDEASLIFDALVDTCGARESRREDFIHYLSQDQKNHEYRFQGFLGFGGKLYHQWDELWVGCYPEDMDKVKQSMIHEAHTRIEEIFQNGES
jgi:hypothetical protein